MYFLSSPDLDSHFCNKNNGVLLLFPKIDITVTFPKTDKKLLKSLFFQLYLLTGKRPVLSYNKYTQKYKFSVTLRTSDIDVYSQEFFYLFLPSLSRRATYISGSKKNEDQSTIVYTSINQLPFAKKNKLFNLRMIEKSSIKMKIKLNYKI